MHSPADSCCMQMLAAGCCILLRVSSVLNLASDSSPQQADAGTATPDHCGAQPMLATPLAQQQQQQEQRLQQRHQQQQQPQLSPLGHDTRPPSPETPPELRSQSSFNSNDGEFDYHAYSLHQLSTLSRPAAGAPAALAADKSVDPRWHRNPIQLYEVRQRGGRGVGRRKSGGDGTGAAAGAADMSVDTRWHRNHIQLYEVRRRGVMGVGRRKLGVAADWVRGTCTAHKNLMVRSGFCQNLVNFCSPSS